MPGLVGGIVGRGSEPGSRLYARSSALPLDLSEPRDWELPYDTCLFLKEVRKRSSLEAFAQRGAA